MNDLDAIGRAEARRLHDEAAAIADTDRAWAELLGVRSQSIPFEDAAPARRRSWLLAAAAALVVATVAAVSWWPTANGPTIVDTPTVPASTSERQAPDTTRPPTTTVTTPTTAAPTTITPTTVAPTTTATPATTLPAIAPTEPDLAVSYLQPPAVVDLAPFVDLPNDSDGDPPGVVVTEGGVVVATDDGRVLSTIGWDGTRRVVPLAEPLLGLLAAGPGDVAYGLAQGSSPTDALVQAVALSGPRAGRVVASTSIDINRFIEPPDAPVGHGPDGLVDRVRVPGETLCTYVDVDGRPITWPDAPPFASIDATDTVRSDGSAVAWPLRIERSPDAPVPYGGPSAPAPTDGGNVIYWTGIGPPDDPTSDYPDSAVNVVATLRPDGTGTWRQLPDGWRIVASDIGGTVLASTDGATTQLARLPAG